MSSAKFGRHRGLFDKLQVTNAEDFLPIVNCLSQDAHVVCVQYAVDETYRLPQCNQPGSPAGDLCQQCCIGILLVCRQARKLSQTSAGGPTPQNPGSDADLTDMTNTEKVMLYSCSCAVQHGGAQRQPAQASVTHLSSVAST